MSRIIKIPGYTKEKVLGYIRQMLTYDKAWQKRAMIQLFERQTNYEKRTNKSVKLNDVGFGKSHANMLSNICKDLIAGKCLNDYQWNMIRSYLPHYAEQVATMCDNDKLLSKLNSYYYGDPNYVDSSKFYNYVEKYFINDGITYRIRELPIKESTDSHPCDAFSLINSQKYEYTFEFIPYEKMATITTTRYLSTNMLRTPEGEKMKIPTTKVLKFSCDENGFIKVKRFLASKLEYYDEG